MPSGGGRITRALKLQDEPIATAEFLVIDTETNGLGGDACEMTEVGAVLVGGGELHDRWESLVRTLVPLRRGNPALHRDHAGDGRRRALPRGGAAAARASGCEAA